MNTIVMSFSGVVALAMPVLWCPDCRAQRPHVEMAGVMECRACLALASREAA